MNKQEMFNKAYLGILKQGKRSTDDNWDNVYRGADGSKCSIGFLIPDELYNKNIEYADVGYPMVLELIPHGEDISLDFLYALQEAHDSHHGTNETFIDQFKTAMSHVANEFGLEVPSDIS